MRIVRKTVFFSALIQLLACTAFGQVFPVFPSGTLPDGSSYRSTLTIANPTAADISCTTRLQQNAQPSVLSTFIIHKASWSLWHLSTYNANIYTPSYLVLTCDQPTAVEARFDFYSATKSVIGEANVLPSSAVTSATFVIDQETSQTRTGVAIANDSDDVIQVTINVYDGSDNDEAITRSFTIDPRTTVTRFIDELTGWDGPTGLVTVTSPSSFFVTGLRFTGPVFSTLFPIVSVTSH